MGYPRRIMANKICEYGDVRLKWLGEGPDEPKNPQKKVVCPECKRKVRTSVLRTFENSRGDLPYQWYHFVPKHKVKMWWKKKNKV